jgi:hypothetical protein
MAQRSNLILNPTFMLPILIINDQNINSQVMIEISKPEGDTFALNLNNTTINTYKIFLESCLLDNDGKIIYKDISPEFKLPPGLKIITEKETGYIVSRFYDKDFVISIFKTNAGIMNNCSLTLSVRQKFGPRLGFKNIQL